MAHRKTPRPAHLRNVAQIAALVAVGAVGCGKKGDSAPEGEKGKAEAAQKAGDKATVKATEKATDKTADKTADKGGTSAKAGAADSAAKPEEKKMADTPKIIPAANPGDLPAPADVAAAPADAKKTASGLAYKILKPGDGTTRPKAVDTVSVHYSGWTTDGKMFDSSVKRGQPATFPLNRVIKGWTEGVPLMTKGAKARFWIPANLAYGETPARPGAPAGMLVFDIELLEVMAAPEPPKVPADVAAAPADAKKTASGLAYKTLKPGDGKTKPVATDKVKVHYSGWTTDGKMFDSSVTRGRPATFPLNRVIKGWTEGVQLMSVGEKTRFWIPADLAYGDNPRGGAPAGTLCFDVELLEILK